MQQIIISGWLSRDAEQQQTQGGQSVTRWNIPVKQGFGDREQTNWFRVSIWGKRADFASKSRKGDFAIVAGDLTIGEYNGKPQYEINASDFQSVRTAPREPDGSRGAPLDQVRGSFPQAEDLDDSVPFLTRDSVW